jgi:hypothetical protein
LADKQGKIIFGGVSTDGAIGILVLGLESEEEARQIYDHDPAGMAGIVYSELHPFRLVCCPDPEIGDIKLFFMNFAYLIMRTGGPRKPGEDLWVAREGALDIPGHMLSRVLPTTPATLQRQVLCRSSPPRDSEITPRKAPVEEIAGQDKGGNEDQF